MDVYLGSESLFQKHTDAGHMLHTLDSLCLVRDNHSVTNWIFTHGWNCLGL